MNVLLVDDDRISIDILAEYIVPHLAGINEVLCAYDGQEAFDIILGTRPEIIVTDIRMPILDGIELIKKLRNIENYEPTVMIISSYSDFNYARDALKLNVVDYILKPVDQDELIAKINATIPNSAKRERTGGNIIEDVQHFLSAHLDESITLTQIANQYHYNAAYLGRLLKEETGYSFSDYLLKLRVIKAQSLLVNTDDTIKNISSAVGFRDPEHFTKRFKHVAGMTPSQYRKEHQSD